MGCAMTDIGKELLAAAEARARGTLWNGPRLSGDQLLAAIDEMRGAEIGADWTDYLATEIAEYWSVLSTETKLTAFILAAESQDRATLCG